MCARSQSILQITLGPGGISFELLRDVRNTLLLYLLLYLSPDSRSKLPIRRLEVITRDFLPHETPERLTDLQLHIKISSQHVA